MASANVFYWGTLFTPDSPQEESVVKAIPCAHQNKGSKRYTFPNTIVAGLRLRTAFPQCRWSGPALPQQLDALMRYKLAVTQRRATTWEDIPGESMPSWKHQQRGTWFAYYCDTPLLSQGMGTGKTKEILDALRMRKIRDALIVTTASAVDDWPDHVALHWPKHLVQPAVVAMGERFERIVDKARLYQIARADIKDRPILGVVSYDSVWREPLASDLMRLSPQAIVADEIHRIASPSSKASNFLSRLGRKVRYRIGASGTVIRHKPEDIFGVMRFLDPGVFGYRYKDFAERYCVYNVPPKGAPNAPPGVPRFVVGYKNEDEFARYFHALTVHCDESVLDLPKPVNVYKRCFLSDKARKFYDEFEAEYIAEFDGHSIEATNSLVKLLRLMQVTSGFVGECSYDPATGEVDERFEHEIDKAKSNLLEETISGIDPSEPIVIFCRFRHDVERARRIASVCGRAVYEQSGQRKEYREWSADGDRGSVLVGQIASASEAISLVRSRYAIFYSLGYSLFQYEQALKRLDRPGQTRQPINVHLLAADTIDGVVYDALRSRKDVIQAITQYFERRKGQRLHKSA